VRQILILVPLAASAIFGQEALTAPQAVALALRSQPSLQASAEAVKAAAARVNEAKGERLPKVDYTESWQRSNNQVFVFGSLLTQRQFTAQNFELGFLNNPPFLNNFQSQVIAEQNVYDFGARRGRIQIARIGQQLAGEESTRTEMDTIANVLQAYYSAMLSKENARVAAEAVRSAQADLTRAQTRLEAGVTTESDVLSIRVHLASMRERQIRADADVELAAATLDQAMGVPLDTRYDLTTPLEAAPSTTETRQAMEADALANRPEPREAKLAVDMNQTQAKVAHAGYLPQFFVRGGFEADRQDFINKGAANWLVSAGLRWNLFNGFSTKAQQQAAEHDAERSRAQARAVESETQLQARRAALAMTSAAQRIEVARAAVAQAQESLRIIRNRYEAGLTEVTELLRGETALLEAQTNELEAVRDQRVAAVMLEAARGKLTQTSDVVTR
jgi:outer membrane protein